jgi:GNAT superfamily N-acetyltransferase
MSDAWLDPAGGPTRRDAQTVQLSVPAGMAYQLIYAAPCRALARGEIECSSQIVAITGLREAWRWHGPLRRCLGALGGLKALAKLASSRRSLYIVPSPERGISHYSWVMVGRCRHYHIRESDAVIGPIWTDERFRGRGFAWAVIRAIAKRLDAQGLETVFIDTSHDNVACQSSIRKAGFGLPVGAKPRH